jgi:hypothetical protein
MDLKWDDYAEEFRRLHLTYAKMSRVFCKDLADQYEILASEAELHHMLDSASSFRKLADEYRRKEHSFSRRQRELWEEQPGGITAPPPRPVHR